MIYPVKPPRDYKIDAYFVDNNYYRLFGFHHTGIDINGRGGGNTDIGLPVYSIYGGIVTEAKAGNGSWGNIVRIWHPGLNIYTRYAHLDRILVKAGTEIPEGTHLGGIGRGRNNAFIAHLHFDMMLKNAVTEHCFDHWPRRGPVGKTDVLANYLNPLHVFNKYGVKYYP